MDPIERWDEPRITRRASRPRAGRPWRPFGWHQLPRIRWAWRGHGGRAWRKGLNGASFMHHEHGLIPCTHSARPDALGSSRAAFSLGRDVVLAAASAHNPRAIGQQMGAGRRSFQATSGPSIESHAAEPVTGTYSDVSVRLMVPRAAYGVPRQPLCCRRDARRITILRPRRGQHSPHP